MKAKTKGRKTSTTVRSEHAYNTLKNMIYEGRLQPGQRLVERKLAKQLTVSRIPLRESLVRLESEGLIRSVANTATFVEDFTAHDLMEIFSMRLALEPLASRLAALRQTSILVQELRRICEKMTKLAEAQEWAKLDQVDFEFHRVIVEASEHERLIRAYDISHIRILSERDYSMVKKAPADLTAQQHLAIVQCIERGDARGAEHANYEHVAGAIKAARVSLGLEEEVFAQQPQGGSRTRR